MAQIRKATAGDEAKVLDLLKQQFSDSADYPFDQQIAAAIFRQTMDDGERGIYLLAEQDGEGIGVVSLSFPIAVRCYGLYACIEEFLVSERARGQGVGSQLLQAVIAEASARGCSELQVNGPTELGYPVYVAQGITERGKHMKIKLSP